MYAHRIGSPIKPKTPSDVRFGSLADISERFAYVRFSPESGHSQRELDVRYVPLADIATWLPVAPSAMVA